MKKTAHFLGIITCQTYIYNRTVKKYIGLIALRTNDVTKIETPRKTQTNIAISVRVATWKYGFREYFASISYSSYSR